MSVPLPGLAKVLHDHLEYVSQCLLLQRLCRLSVCLFVPFVLFVANPVSEFACPDGRAARQAIRAPWLILLGP
jgi:hypothetical protein